MHQETIEAVAWHFQLAYEDMLKGKPEALPLARFALARMEGYGKVDGSCQKYLRVMEEDFDYAKAVYHRVKS